jgi:hypothetical protein
MSNNTKTTVANQQQLIDSSSSTVMLSTSLSGSKSNKRTTTSKGSSKMMSSLTFGATQPTKASGNSKITEGLQLALPLLTLGGVSSNAFGASVLSTTVTNTPARSTSASLRRFNLMVIEKQAPDDEQPRKQSSKANILTTKSTPVSLTEQMQATSISAIDALEEENTNSKLNTSQTALPALRAGSTSRLDSLLLNNSLRTTLANTPASSQSEAQAYRAVDSANSVASRRKDSVVSSSATNNSASIEKKRVPSLVRQSSTNATHAQSVSKTSPPPPPPPPPPMVHPRSQSAASNSCATASAVPVVVATSSSPTVPPIPTNPPKPQEHN